MKSKSYPLGWTGTGWMIVIAAIVVVGGMIALLLATGDGGKDNWHLLIRSTAQTSVIAFLLAFVAGPLRTLMPGNDLVRQLFRQRRYIGVSYAISHFFHLGAIIGTVELHYGGQYLEFTEPFVWVGGGGVFFMLFLMTITSTDGMIKRLGPKTWRGLHWFGMIYSWVIFTQSYVPRALEVPIYWSAAAPMLIAMGLRAAAFIKKRRLKAQRSTA